MFRHVTVSCFIDINSTVWSSHCPWQLLVSNSISRQFWNWYSAARPIDNHRACIFLFSNMTALNDIDYIERKQYRLFPVLLRNSLIRLWHQLICHCMVRMERQKCFIIIILRTQFSGDRDTLSRLKCIEWVLPRKQRKKKTFRHNCERCQGNKMMQKKWTKHIAVAISLRWIVQQWIKFPFCFRWNPLILSVHVRNIFN